MNIPRIDLNIVTPSQLPISPLANLTDLEALVRATLHDFEGEADTASMRSRMYAEMDQIAASANIEQLLADGSAVQFPVWWQGLDYGTEIVFEISDEHQLRVWLREKDDTSGRIIKMLFETPEQSDAELRDTLFPDGAAGMTDTERDLFGED